MEIIEYTCVPNLTSMRTILSKFDSEEVILPEAFFVGGCHGND